MASYQPPTENLIAFNSSVFKTANESTLTLSEAQALFLGRTGNPTSTATTTTFNGSLTTSEDIYVNSVRAGVGKLQSTTNTCFGNGAMATTTTGLNNSAIGKNALSIVTTGNQNTYVGVNNLIGSLNNVSGSYNTSVGFSNGQQGGYSSSDYNVYMGTGLRGRGSSIIIGNDSSASVSTIVIGNSSGSSGNSSITIGNGISLSQSKIISIGDSSSAGGLRAICLGADTIASGIDSTAIGYGASATVANSIVLGTATEFVSCPGTSANGSLITAADIFVNGVRAGAGLYRPVADVSMNTCFGRNALGATSIGIMNTAVGNTALAALNTGSDNTAVGNKALNALTSGIRNVAVGANSLIGITTGNRNTAIGQGTGQLLATSVSDSTFLGYLAGGSVTSGQNNTFVGSTITSLTNCNNSTALGAFSGVAGFSNSTAIGGGTSAAVPGAICTVANQIMLGRTTETVYCPGVPTTGSTTYTSLVLSGGLQLQSAYSITPTSNMLGYQLTNTTGFTIASFTSASPTNISSAGIDLTAGVWNINYSIELSIATATATVSAQTLFCSLTTNGVYATQRISNSGITRIHSTNTYLVTDTPCFSGSFNYYVSSATTVYPIFQITFTAGPTISGVGFYRATRIG